jgi:hypothetical protein
VISGSANLSLAALSGRQKEVYIVFDGKEAYRSFADYYGRDAGEAAPVPADHLVTPSENGVLARTAPLAV